MGQGQKYIKTGKGWGSERGEVVEGDPRPSGSPRWAVEPVPERVEDLKPGDEIERGGKRAVVEGHGPRGVYLNIGTSLMYDRDGRVPWTFLRRPFPAAATTQTQGEATCTNTSGPRF